MRAPPSRRFDFEFTHLIAEFTMCNLLLSSELKFLQDRYGFFQTPLSRYAIDLPHPATRYAIAAAMPLLFQITAHVWYVLY